MTHWEYDQQAYAERKRESEDAFVICLLGMAVILALAWVAPYVEMIVEFLRGAM